MGRRAIVRAIGDYFRSSLLLGCCFLLLIASGCGGTVRQLETKTNADLSAIRSAQAAQSAELENIRTELRMLAGKVEELDFIALKKTRELESQLHLFGSRVPPPEGVPGDLLTEDEERIGRNTGAAADLFKQGLQYVRGGDFAKGRNAFETFFTQNPDTAFSDNALFWIGICYDKLAQYDRAIVAYSDVFQKFPAEDRVAPALLHLAESFVKIDSRDNAIDTFQKLVDEHPRSEYASVAKKRLKDLKSKKRGRKRR